MADSAMTPGGNPGEQVLVATVPTPMMETAEGLTGEKTATSWAGDYTQGHDGAGNGTMQNQNGPGGGGPDLLNDSNCGCDRSGSMSMMDQTGPKDTGPVKAQMSWPGEGSSHTDNSMRSYEAGSYNSGVR